MSTDHTANADMVEHWNGPEGQHWVDHEAGFDAMLEPFVVPILDAAAIATSHHVLDIGCGNGALSRAAASRAARVTGVDISGPMIERARERAAAAPLEHVDFVVADAQVEPLPADVDVVMSRFGVMFFDDPDAAFRNLRASLTDHGGRIVFVCWRALEHNDWVTVPAAAVISVVGAPEPIPPDAPGPFALADPDRLRAVLGGAGFSRVELTELDLPLLLGGGGDVDTAVAFMAGSGLGKRFLAGASPEEVDRALEVTRAALVPFAGSDGVRLGSAAWLVSAEVAASR